VLANFTLLGLKTHYPVSLDDILQSAHDISNFSIPKKPYIKGKYRMITISVRSYHSAEIVYIQWINFKGTIVKNQ